MIKLLKMLRTYFRKIAGPISVRFANLRSAGRVRVVIGASGLCPQGWIRTEQEYFDLLDLSQMSSLLKPGSVDMFLAEHVWEHLSPEDGLVAARNCWTLLGEKGRLRIAVPDALHPDPEYQEHVRIGGTGPGADDHKCLYSWRSLSQMLETAGFEVRLLEHWDDDGNFRKTDWNAEDGLVRRSARFDARNAGGVLRYTSLIVDAIKVGPGKAHA